MKKFFQYLVIILAGLMVVGVILIAINPSDRDTDELFQPGKAGEKRWSPDKASILLSSDLGGRPDNKVRSQFTMGEKIYATVKLKDLEKGDYILTYHWIKPGGGVQERYKKKFHSPGGNYKCWSWIELTGDELISFSIGPFGSGKFLGEWTVRVYLNGLFLGSEDFKVN